MYAFCRVDLGLNDAEIEELDVARYEALAKRIEQREKLQDIRIAKIQFAIYTATCGPKWSDGSEILLSDFLPGAETAKSDFEAKRLMNALDIMASRDSAKGGV